LLDASRVLNAASQAGFRESGAVGVAPSKDGSTSPMVGVRSAGLSFDSIVGFENDDGSIVSLVDEGYLSVLLALSNVRFKTNSERIGRFQTHLKQLQQNKS
jgi:tRNA wybutosine-synthesizing protein 3